MLTAGVSLAVPDFLRNTSAPFESTIVYASDGSVLATIHAGEKRITVPLSKISPYLIKAVIASEDQDFFNHKGISIKAMVRAGIANLFHGRIVQGGSTLTQQLARSLFLSTKKTFNRKISEAYYAVELEKNYTKEEILEMYLNQVYWGHNTYGAAAASQLYFGKDPEKLTLSEAALLSGVLGAPELYSPYKNFALAAKKRDTVIDKMQKLGMISAETARKTMAEKITLSMGKVNKYKYNAPYFTSSVINQLSEKYGRDTVFKGGLRIYTTLSMPVQKAAEEAVNLFITKEGPKFRFSQAALTAIDPNSGYVLAMVGGADFDKSEYNRAVQAKRSPGSSFKPFIYAAAMETGISPGDVILDSPTAFEVYATAQNPDGKWRPKNFDKRFRGPVTVQQALAFSLNIPAIKLLEEVGIENAVNLAHRMGITSALTPALSLVLGTSDVSLFEMTSAFGVFAAGGERAEPMSVLKVTDKDGKVLEENKPKRSQVLDPDVANIMVMMMKDVIGYGTGHAARLTRPAAAKTGTSNDFKDAWFVGFVPQMVAGVWVGNDNNTPMKGVAEVSICPRIWKSFMVNALKDIPAKGFPKPGNIVSIKECTYSGKLPGPNCPAKYVKWGTFWVGKEPDETCTSLHGIKPVIIPSPEAESQEQPEDSSDEPVPQSEGTQEFNREDF